MASILVDHGAGRHAPSDEPAQEEPHRHHGRGVAPSPEPVAMPAITVNGVAIPRKAIAAEVQHFPAATPGEGWRAAARALVVRELLLQEARRLAVVATPQADADGRVETDEDALLRALVEREVKVPEADEATLRRFYDNNRRRFVTPPLWEADHILIAARRDDAAAFAAARERARALAEGLAKAPARFAELAREVSDCPSGALGGSLGQIGPGDTTAEFEAGLAALEPGTLSAPVETRYGVHLIRRVRRMRWTP